ncbi:glycine cleavage system protein H [Caldimonas thermodepolymerans]|jgi:glycine cleavage system H protein|uniref:Glycine cleavage system H protein n=1 Tax=Caldimonas thermodepolymerans TaxID=215580 RepID=A0AA46HWC5_9BURK|nr:glycine cleavage system protein H [Caldimonas thermodepolymerans]TCP07978.1 glycine cleavage system H protein [Caldimonas thermodepolymerans]UZG45148.1 glycine cleavage system protein H [Caldimonas thermodepolymerans]UZG48895.1 glycine cleavage system protein H [Caldimonas thermodepolymerans]
MNICGFEFPDELWILVEHQVWARLHEDGAATVGITSVGAREAGEIYMCRPKPVGTRVERGRSVAVVELAKSIVSVKSPVGGEVVEVNPRLAQEPELAYKDVYGDGWLVRLRVSDFEADRPHLRRGEALRGAVEHYLWLNKVERP